MILSNNKKRKKANSDVRGYTNANVSWFTEKRLYQFYLGGAKYFGDPNISII